MYCTDTQLGDELRIFRQGNGCCSTEGLLAEVALWDGNPVSNRVQWLREMSWLECGPEEMR